MENNFQIVPDYFDLNQSFREINEIVSLIPNQNLSSCFKKEVDQVITDFCNTDIKELRFPVAKSYLSPKVNKLFANCSSLAEFSIMTAHFLANSDRVKAKFTLKYDKYASFEEVKKEFPSLSSYTSVEANSTLEFSKFTQKLSEWHIGVEMTVFYFNLIRYLTDNPEEITELSSELVNFEFESGLLEKAKEASLNIISKVAAKIDRDANYLRVGSALGIMIACLLNASPYSVCLEKAAIFIFGPTVLKMVPKAVCDVIDGYLSKNSFRQLSKDIEEQSFKAVCLENAVLDLTKLILAEKGKIALSQSKKEIIYTRAKRIGKYFKEVAERLQNADEQVRVMILSDMLKFEETRVKDFKTSFILINKQK